MKGELLLESADGENAGVTKIQNTVRTEFDESQVFARLNKHMSEISVVSDYLKLVKTTKLGPFLPLLGGGLVWCKLNF